MIDEVTRRVTNDLAGIVKGDVFGDIFHRAAFSSDASIYQIVPMCVVAPRDAEDVAAVVKYAREKKIPVVARGAGSGLAGESLSEGIVFDMSRYMNRILGVVENGEKVICEPGAVFEAVNGALAKYGRMIGPDPSSGDRATIGGITANNATGAHSLRYGHIEAYVESVEAVLADGSIVEIGNGIEARSSGNEKVKALAKSCEKLLAENEEIIEKALPRTKRNRSGYNIAGICHDGKIDLARMLAGSEGTLAIFTKVTLRTVAVPKVKSLLSLEFDSIEWMAKAVPVIVESGAAACELMDKSVVDMAAEALPEYRDVLPIGAAVSLLVEHTGQAQDEVQAKIDKTDAVVGNLAAKRKIIFDKVLQQRLWKSRKDAVPLLYRRKGKEQPIPFMEDVSVDNKLLGEYIAGLDKIKQRYGIEMSYYGHAGDGELHVRPYIDLSAASGVEKMRAVANDVFELAWSLGGSISGEHADGLVRTAFIKKQYGEKYYAVLREIKRIFDAEGLMNPGKIISDDPDLMVKNLRAEHQFVPERLKSEMKFGDDELMLELWQCNGCGVCLNKGSNLRMCPIYMAMGDELGSSRAKNNILRFWATGQLSDEDFESDEFRLVLGLCANCKMCALQCPSGVDVSKLITAARAEYVRRKGLRRAETVLSRNRYLSILGSKFAPIANFVMGLGIVRWTLEMAGGLDSRRRMPRFGFGSFLAKGRRYLAKAGRIEKPIDKVAYFVDTYANYNDHELGFAVIKLLRANGVEVVLPKQRPVPMPSIVYGDVKQAKRDLEFNVKHLAEAVIRGYKIICSEPSAAMCLRDELRYFVNGDDAKAVSENTFELMGYLAGLAKEGKLKAAQKRVEGEFAYHLPCHLMFAGGGKETIELFDKLLGKKVVNLNAGCCGIAGTFGMQKKNYDLSLKIGESLRNAIAANKGKIVLTECAACKMQIEHMSEVKTVHPIKVLAEGYGL